MERSENAFGRSWWNNTAPTDPIMPKKELKRFPIKGMRRFTFEEAGSQKILSGLRIPLGSNASLMPLKRRKWASVKTTST